MNDGRDTWNYSYGPLDRLSRVYLNGSLTAKYTYDSGGRRVKMWDTGEGTVDYVYSGLNVVDEVNNGSHERHVYAGGMHLAVNSSGAVEYYHVDHLGSTRLKTSSTGGGVYESSYCVVSRRPGAMLPYIPPEPTPKGSPWFTTLTPS